MSVTEPIVDSWVAPFFPAKGEAWRGNPRYAHVSNLFSNKEGPSIDTHAAIKEMDAAGVRWGMIGGCHHPNSYTPNDWVGEQAALYPDRLIPIAGVNAELGMTAVRELEYLVKEKGFRGLRIFPYGHKMPPNHAVFYPLYAKCIELDVPVQLQVGHTAAMLPSDPGRPIYLDDVAAHFPELKIVGAHIGYPWTDEMIAVAWKHPNVYIDTTAHFPKNFQSQFVKFLKTYGQDKVIFGTSYPATLPSIQRALREVEMLELPAAVRRKFLYENAMKVWKIPTA